ncbi:phosphonate ABC transporter ATP-binding protein [Salinicoccus kekensis]|uniref:Phosphonate transport system ATP-binding protein n=1 Tax=Salinicoccus kekensis TaxID=714307 RepID=A0A285U9X1_9STAP|nr:phosphonate ABC transporter ATP-binding protein [Salinicoccus kekensis]SOC38622.1 phosphonate transport system ATP-binding protein [Salinicoccus kekensis]
MNAIEVNKIRKVYNQRDVALDGVSFTIKEGESVVILGHNGSGKSTLFRTLTGFEEPTEGSVTLLGREVDPGKRRHLRETRKKVGMVFQAFGLIDNVSVFQNVLFGALGQVKFAPATYSLFASDALRTRAMECLDRVGLAHLSERRADRLSGGQKQRIAIARMLMQDPEIILADEPIASLDPKAGREVMDLLAEIAAERNITLLMILHQIPIAKRYADRFIALKNGEVYADGEVSVIDEDFETALFGNSGPKEEPPSDETPQPIEQEARKL